MYFRYNATSSCVGDNVVEPGDIENMQYIGVGILFLAVLCVGIMFLLVKGRHIYFQYNATSSDIVDHTIE